MSGFANVIGRWFRRHTAEHMPEQKGVFRATSVPTFSAWTKGWSPVKGAASEPTLSPPVFGDAAGARQYWDQPEIFEGMVGFTNLCKIARAADNLESLLTEMAVDNEDDAGIELKGDEGSIPLLQSALNELCRALEPYRTARDMCRTKR